MSTVADAVTILAQVLTSVTNAVAQASQVSTIIQGAQAQSRTELTDAEWAIVNTANAQSRSALAEAINKAFAAAGLTTVVA